MADEFTKAALYGIKTFNKKVKEKIGMMELIELLNEYEREAFPEEHEYIEFPDGTYDDGGYWYYEEDPSLGEQEGFNYTSRGDKRNSELNLLLIISKEFGFIKWLVENDKIDMDKLDSRYSKVEYKPLLMLLSISDTPIEDLCGYLKDDATEKTDTLLEGIKKSCESLGI